MKYPRDEIRNDFRTMRPLFQRILIQLAFIVDKTKEKGMRRLFLKKCMVLPGVLFLMLPLTALSQPWPGQVVQGNARRYRESLFLQTDRDIYISGEKVWFKVYKLNAGDGTPDNYSRVVYLELLNRSGYPVNQIRIAIKKASAASGFRLSDTLSTGKYLLRAYTNWMKNFSQSEFAFKTISVFNPGQAPEDIYRKDPETDTLFFFPEDGKYVAGINTKVRVSACNALHDPLPVSGALINREGDTVCAVSTPGNGPGFFSFIPRIGEQYRFIYQDATGNKNTYLPGTIDSAGIKLIAKTEHNPSFLDFSVVSSPARQTGACYLFVRKGGIYQLLRSIEPAKDRNFTLKKKRLPEGISEIILADKNGDIRSVRRIYNPPEDRILIGVRFDKKSYGPRERVRVTIRTTRGTSTPVKANLTVAIAKSGLINETRNNIRDRDAFRTFFLSGITDTRHINIRDFPDLLPFGPFDKEVSDILRFHPIHYYPELENKLISGKITDFSSGVPLRRAEIFFSYVDKTARCRIFSTDSSGNFFININETGSRELVIQPYQSEIKNYYVELRQDFLPGAHHPLPGSYFPDTSRLKILENAVLTKQIEDIFSSGRAGSENPEKYRYYSFYGEPVHRVVLSDYIPLSDVREVLKEIVPWVSVHKRKGKTVFRMYSDIMDIPLSDPLVLVDGTPFTDLDQLLKVPASGIQAIDVINLRYFFGRHVFNGIIHFITTKGNMEPLELDPGIFRVDYPVLDRPRIARFPEYHTETVPDRRRPDFRNTLYWNPNLETGDDGTVTFEFYTSDEPGDYRVFVEGISPDGITGKSSYRLKVIPGQ